MLLGTGIAVNGVVKPNRTLPASAPVDGRDRFMASERGSPARLTGLVLCGGAGQRVGGDKALLTVGGQPLVDRVVARLRQVCAPVVLAAGDDPRRLADRADGVVCDEPPGAGPLAGVAAGLAAAGSEAVAVCAVDHPHANPRVLADLAAMGTGRHAAVPVVDGWPQPLHAVWTRASLATVRAYLAAGHRSVRGALDQLDWVAVDRSVWGRHDPEARFAADIDTPDDLAGAGG